MGGWGGGVVKTVVERENVKRPKQGAPLGDHVLTTIVSVNV